MCGRVRPPLLAVHSSHTVIHIKRTITNTVLPCHSHLSSLLSTLIRLHNLLLLKEQWGNLY